MSIRVERHKRYKGNNTGEETTFGKEHETKCFNHSSPLLNVDHKLLKPVIKFSPCSQKEHLAGLALSGKPHLGGVCKK